MTNTSALSSASQNPAHKVEQPASRADGTAQNARNGLEGKPRLGAQIYLITARFTMLWVHSKRRRALYIYSGGCIPEKRNVCTSSASTAGVDDASEYKQWSEAELISLAEHLQQEIDVRDRCAVIAGS